MPETFPKSGEDRVPPFSAVTAAFGGHRRVPPPVNEPVKAYAPGSPEKAEVKARLKEMGERARTLARPDAARRIAELCLQIARGGRP